MNENVVKIDSKMYDFPRLNYETDKSYFLRKEFFTKANPKSERDYLKAITLSICWANISLFNCEYPPKVMEDVSSITT